MKTQEPITFEQLTVNTPFRVASGETLDVRVKIDDSRFIITGHSGAHTIEFREIYVIPL